MSRDIDPALVYVDELMGVARKRVKEHGRLAVGKFGVPDDVFIAVESRLRFHLSRGLKPNDVWGTLEDSVLLAAEKHYSISRRNPKFDVDDWFAYVDDTVLHGEAEVYLWWKLNGLESYPSPEKFRHRIALLETVMANGLDDDLIGMLFD